MPWLLSLPKLTPLRKLTNKPLITYPILLCPHNNAIGKTSWLYPLGVLVEKDMRIKTVRWQAIPAYCLVFLSPYRWSKSPTRPCSMWVITARLDRSRRDSTMDPQLKLWGTILGYMLLALTISACTSLWIRHHLKRKDLHPRRAIKKRYLILKRRRKRLDRKRRRH